MSKFWEKLEILGSGTYGEVIKGRHQKTNELLAIKKIKIEPGNFGIVDPITLREVVILTSLKHDNIVKLFDVLFTNNKTYLVFEYLKEDLKIFHSKNNFELNNDLIKHIMKQLLTGLNYIHLKNYVHRDLKPSNILIDYINNDDNNKENIDTNNINKKDNNINMKNIKISDIRVKIADFGLARLAKGDGKQKQYTRNLVTLGYRSPEILFQNDYDEKSDIWSIGCIFAELLINMQLFKGENEADQLNKIFYLLGTPTDFSMFNNVKCRFSQYDKKDFKKFFLNINPLVNENALDLLEKMIAINPKDRITAKKSLNHVYFN